MSAIQSPIPGTFYHRPSPEDAAYKNRGDKVEVGDTIGLVEVMKTFIEIKAEIAGVFASYAVDNAQPVTAGQVLAELEG